MKTLLTISTLVFTVMFSSTSFGGWTKVSEDSKGTYYVDFERIRKHDGYVFYWRLFDYLKPDEYGNLSEKNYVQVDCKLFRFKILSGSFHKEPMGRGTPETVTPKNPQWEYPSPNSVHESHTESVCNR